MNKEVQELIPMARRWREWVGAQITCMNPDCQF